MKRRPETYDVFPILIGLDEIMLARLMNMARENGTACIEQLAYSILRDVLEDDYAAHEGASGTLQ